MSTLIFLRHGHSAANAAGLLTGQLPDVKLSKSGFKQAEALTLRIGKNRIDHLHISPIERCQLTIDPWLRSKYSSSLLSMNIVDGISEIDFGSWSGRKISSLSRLPLWKDVQQNPSKVTFPDGESFKKVQKRAVAAVEEIAATKGNRTHLIVSHSDTIKLISSHLLGLKLDSFQQLQISPASFTVFRIGKNSKAPRFSLQTMNNLSTLAEILD